VALWHDVGSVNYNLLQPQEIFDARQSNDGQSRATDPSLSIAEQVLAAERAQQDLRDRNPGTVIKVKEFGEFRIEGSLPTSAEQKIIVEEIERRKSDLAEAVSNDRLRFMLIRAGSFVIPLAVVLALNASLVWAFRGYRRTKPE
jgi:hypothetical protein